MRFITSKNRASQKYLETTSRYSTLVQFIARSRKRTAILPNKVHCGRSLSAEFIEKATCMKTKEQLYQCESAKPLLCTKQIRNVDYKIYPDKKQDHLGKHKAMPRASEKTGCNFVDCGGPGISISAVQQQDEQRQPTVAKLIEKSESNHYKEQFPKDMSQTRKINRFSEASQKLLKNMNQTEI